MIFLQQTDDFGHTNGHTKKNARLKRIGRPLSREKPLAKLSEHFDEAEFACRCQRAECDAAPIDAIFVERLEELRSAVAKRLGRSVPFVVTSARRCREHNRRVGGAATSRHLLGDAVDLAALSDELREAIIAEADILGFGGIGVAKTFVHVDGRKRAKGFPPVRWSYGPRAVA